MFFRDFFSKTIAKKPSLNFEPSPKFVFFSEKPSRSTLNHRKKNHRTTLNHRKNLCFSEKKNHNHRRRQRGRKLTLFPNHRTIAMSMRHAKTRQKKTITITHNSVFKKSCDGNHNRYGLWLDFQPYESFGSTVGLLAACLAPPLSLTSFSVICLRSLANFQRE